MASCVPAGVLGEPDQVLVPIVLIPGRAAAVTQGTINPDSPAGLRQLLADGLAPEDAVDALLEVDDQPTARQYGIATMTEPATATGPETGSETEPETGSETGSETGTGSYAYTGDDAEPERGDAVGAEVAVQGVLLADEAVVDRALTAFERSRADGQSLEQALVAGLVAGSEAGGDRRCESQTALFAHLAVADVDDDARRPSLLITVTVDEGDGQNPVPMLARALTDGQRGWVDLGLDDPVGIPRVAVMGVGLALAIAAFFTIRAGMGSRSARR